MSVVFILFTSAYTGFGQTKDLSLDDAIRIAIQNNKEINAYDLKVKESIALRPSAFTIDKTLVYYGYDQNNVAENGFPLNVLGLEQNFNFPTLYVAQGHANDVNISIAETELIRQKQLLSKDVSQAFHEIQYLLHRQQVFLKIDSLYRSFDNGMERRYQQGDISRLDLLNAKAKQQQINTTINELKYNLKSAYQKLQALIQYDSVFEISLQPMNLIPVKEFNPDSSPGIQLMKMRTNYQNAMLRVERNRMLPDLSLSYFIGTNSYTGSKYYQGFQFGVSLPLFYGVQQAKINANKISITIQENLLANDLTTLKAKQAVLSNELIKYQESVDLYLKSGKLLSEEIIRTSQTSYKMGEIDFFQFVLSIENALALTISYYENVSKYNQVALEINYLTK